MVKLLTTLLITSGLQAKTLIMIGGGSRPESALKHFISKAQIGPIYVLPWGTSYPIESFEEIKGELESIGAQQEIKCFCTDQFTSKDREEIKKREQSTFQVGTKIKS
jgi:hypothetical protein